MAVDFYQWTPGLGPAVVTWELTEWAFGLHRVGLNDAFDDELCIRWQEKISPFSFDHWDGFAFDATEKFVFGNVFRKCLRPDDHDSGRCPRLRRFQPVCHLPGARDVQARIFFREKDKAPLLLALQHHAVGADIR